MQRTHIYLPEELNRQIDTAVKATKKSKSEIIREALAHGIKTFHAQPSRSAQALVNLAHLAKTITGTGPRDVSMNHDYYAWGSKKRTTT